MLDEFDFGQFLLNELEKAIPNIVYFAIGIIIGFILFIAVFFILTSFGKKKVFEKERVIVPNDLRYKVIIKEKAKIFMNEYANLPIKERAGGMWKIIISMMEEISKLYYPNSQEPLFEVSLDQLVDFLDYFVKRIDYSIEKILTNNLKIIDANTKLALKEMKISAAIELLNRKKENPKEDISTEVIEAKPQVKKKGLFGFIKEKVVDAGKSIALNYTGKVINNEFNDVIRDLGEDINKLYTNQKLIFTDAIEKNSQDKKDIKDKKSFLIDIIKKVGGKHD